MVRRSLATLLAAALSVGCLVASGPARAALEPRMPARLAVSSQLHLALVGPTGQPVPDGVLRQALVVEATEPPGEGGRMALEYVGGVGLQFTGLLLSVVPLLLTIQNGTFD